jgi:hypothetical protein
MRLKTYSSFINESVRDKMTPKSEEDILKVLEDMDPYRLFKAGEWRDDEWLMITAIERGLDMDFDVYGKEVMNTVVRQNFLKVTKHLLDKGIDFKPYKDFDPFYTVALNGHIMMARLLMKHNVKLNKAPLEVARLMSNTRLAAILQDYYDKTH